MANTGYDIANESIEIGKRLAAKKRILLDIDTFVKEADKTYKDLQKLQIRQAEFCVALKQMADDIKVALS